MNTVNSNKSSAWLKSLKKLGVNTDKLKFNELLAFKDVDRYLNDPIEGTNEWKYLIKSFKLLTSFSFLTLYDNKFDSLTNCWSELERLFMNREIFKDGLFIQSWLFCNFPLNNKKETLLDYFEVHLESESMLDTYKPFIKSMKNSRLGLYQEIMSSKKTMKLKELFTNKIIKAENTVHEYQKGEIFLTRFVEINNKIYFFGDPKCWPKEFKIQLEDMIMAKLFYFKGQTINEQYEKFMEYAGPYWMSCVVTDQNCPILQPDRYLDYQHS